MKKITTIVIALLFVAPGIAGAQTIQSFQIQQLLSQDLGQLIALNGEDTVRSYIFQLLILLSQQQRDNGFIGTGNTAEELYGTPHNNNSSHNDEPDVRTEDADDVDSDSAELNGSVDMNDFNNGLVFFVWGEDEDEVQDVEDEDEYRDVRERGDDLQKQRVDSDLDGDEDYFLDIRNLDRNTDYYFALCVEYEDKDDDEVIDCGSVEEFDTDRNSSSRDDEPDVKTDDAQDIEDDSAELNGSVDMNDFNNGLVFFVWGDDEDDIEDARDEDEYDDIDERGDALQKQQVDFDLDGSDDFSLDVNNLEDNTDYYFSLCVEYEDEDDDQAIKCGSVEEFETDN